MNNNCAIFLPRPHSSGNPYFCHVSTYFYDFCIDSLLSPITVHQISSFIFQIFSRSVFVWLLSPSSSFLPFSISSLLHYWISRILIVLFYTDITMSGVPDSILQLTSGRAAWRCASSVCWARHTAADESFFSLSFYQVLKFMFPFPFLFLCWCFLSAF